jgi:hypothetical protein
MERGKNTRVSRLGARQSEPNVRKKDFLGD